LLQYRLALRWKHRPTRANGQLAVAGYLYDPAKDSHVPAVIDMLTLRASRSPRSPPS